MQRLTTVFNAILVCGLAFSSRDAIAQPNESGKAFILIAFDTKDQTIGKSCTIDSYRIRRTFSALPKERLGGNGIVTLEGDDFKLDKITSAIAEMKPAEADSVVIFLSCHGVMKERKHHFVIDGKFVPRADLLGVLKQKRVRLAALISDSCAVSWEGFRAIGHGKDTDKTRLLTDLFIRSKGVVDINSAAENEAAFGSDQNGGLLMASFADLCSSEYKSLDKNNQGFVSWKDEFMPALKQKTERSFETLKRVAERSKGMSAGARQLITQGRQTIVSFTELPGQPR